MKQNTSSNLIAFFILFVYFFIPIFASFSDFFFSEDSGNNPFDYARITDVDYTAVLVDEPGSNAKVNITERLTFDIHAASKDNLFWELWRDLPEDRIDGLDVDYRVKSVKQILDDGTEQIYYESPKLYWEDEDYTDTYYGLGPGKWYHSEGPYSEYNRQYECVFFYVDGLYRENVTFEIEYEMNNAAFKYGDCSELYLCMYSEETIKHLKSFKGQILIPSKDMPAQGNYDAHTYGTNYNDFEFTESTTIHPGYHTFSFDLDESELKFKSYNQYIEFSLISYGVDKHIFTENAPDNYYSNAPVLAELRQDHKEYEETYSEALKNKIIVLLICVAATFFIIIRNLLNADNKTEKKYNFYEPTLKMDYFREIPSNLDPMFAATLAFCKDKKPKDVEDNYAAIMLSLVRKGYIELERIDNTHDWVFNNVKIVIKNKPIQLHPSLYLVQNSLNELFEPEKIELEPLTPTEEAYFNLIVKHTIGSEIAMSTFQNKVSDDYENTDSFVETIDKSTVNIGVSQGYFQKADYKEPQKKLKSRSTFYLVMGIIFIVFVNLFSSFTRLDLAFGGFTYLGIAFIFGSFHLKALSKKYILLTQFGEDEYVKWKGLYEFLNSETLMDERTVVELPMWEQYLVYATAFGISDKVIKAINIKCPEIVDSSPILSNSYYRSRSFYTSNRRFRTVTRNASHTARFASGSYGGYGGYGGGGRGGGGGGGGH